MTSTETQPRRSRRQQASPPSEVHLTATQLADAVAMVKPHLGKDDTLPMLTAYRLDVRDGDLWLSATDRYSAASARIEPIIDTRTELQQKFAPDFHAVIPGDLVHRALTILKPNRRYRAVDPRIAIRVTAYQTVIEERDLPIGWEPTRLAAAPPGPPPDILQLLHSVLEAVRDAKSWGGRAGFNARFLDRFAGVPKFVGGNEPIILRKAPGMKPLVVTCGDVFIGALMPIRLIDGITDEADLAKWIARLTPKATS